MFCTKSFKSDNHPELFMHVIALRGKYSSRYGECASFMFMCVVKESVCRRYPFFFMLQNEVVGERKE
jgi:esterase/lipase superfamily enzyme